MPDSPDAVVAGSGPNGLAAAIRLAQAGRSVTLCEAAATLGGGARSAELTLPGFVHDPFAAVFPIAAASPFFRGLDLGRHALTMIEPPAALAHPLDDGRAVMLYRSLDRTADGLGADRDVYVQLMEPLVADAQLLAHDLLAPPRGVRHPLASARFGLHGIRSAVGFACSHFHGDEARALIAGNAAHSLLPLEAPLTAGFGLLLTILAHAVGWPIPRGGAGQLSVALLSLLHGLGAEVRVAAPRTLLPRDVESLGVKVYHDFPEALAGADVVMTLRIQQERLVNALLPNTREYSRTFGLDRERLALAAPDAIVMHPGPLNRGVEISDEVADGPQSVVLNQVEAGVAVRMAVLYLYAPGGAETDVPSPPLG